MAAHDPRRAKELVFSDDQAVVLRPDSEGFASGTVERREAAQLPELLRELRDFR